MSNLHPCDETFDVGPFRFECIGHAYAPDTLAWVARHYHGGKIAHHSGSPEQVGDVNVTWWTEAGS